MKATVEALAEKAAALFERAEELERQLVDARGELQVLGGVLADRGHLEIHHTSKGALCVRPERVKVADWRALFRRVTSDTRFNEHVAKYGRIETQYFYVLKPNK